MNKPSKTVLKDNAEDVKSLCSTLAKSAVNILNEHPAALIQFDRVINTALGRIYLHGTISKQINAQLRIMVIPAIVNTIGLPLWYARISKSNGADWEHSWCELWNNSYGEKIMLNTTAIEYPLAVVSSTIDAVGHGIQCALAFWLGWFERMHDKRRVKDDMLVAQVYQNMEKWMCNEQAV